MKVSVNGVNGLGVFGRLVCGMGIATILLSVARRLPSEEARHWCLVGGGIAVVVGALLWAVGWRRTSCDEEGLEQRDLLGSRRLAWADVSTVSARRNPDASPLLTLTDGAGRHYQVDFGKMRGNVPALLLAVRTRLDPQFRAARAVIEGEGLPAVCVGERALRVTTLLGVFGLFGCGLALFIAYIDWRMHQGQMGDLGHKALLAAAVSAVVGVALLVGARMTRRPVIFGADGILDGRDGLTMLLPWRDVDRVLCVAWRNRYGSFDTLRIAGARRRFELPSTSASYLPLVQWLLSEGEMRSRVELAPRQFGPLWTLMLTTGVPGEPSPAPYDPDER